MMVLTTVIVVAAMVTFLEEWAGPLKRMVVGLYPSGPVAAAPEPTPYVLWAEWIGGLQ
jgi:hypothetical protein